MRTTKSSLYTILKFISTHARWFPLRDGNGEWQLNMTFEKAIFETAPVADQGLNNIRHAWFNLDDLKVLADDLGKLLISFDTEYEDRVMATFELQSWELYREFIDWTYITSCNNQERAAYFEKIAKERGVINVPMDHYHELIYGYGQERAEKHLMKVAPTAIPPTPSKSALRLFGQHGLHHPVAEGGEEEEWSEHDGLNITGQIVDENGAFGLQEAQHPLALSQAVLMATQPTELKDPAEIA